VINKLECPEINSIRVIGVGGIGLSLLPSLCRYLNYHPEIDDVDVFLIDGDEYEARNQSRQAFQEMGNKAEVTRRQYETEFQNLFFNAVQEYLTEDNIGYHVREGDIIFCCVDNHSTRKLVIEECQNLENMILISGGNDLYDGNVSIYIRVDGEDVTKSPIEVYPEIASPPEGDENPGDVDEEREGGCANEVESTPQILFANNMAAAMMGNAFYQVVEGKHGNRGDWYFDINTNATRQNERAMPNEAQKIN